jgi:hypothetical protein
LRDLQRIIVELEQQKEAIDRALTALREVAEPGQTQTATKKRRGRPPAKKQSRMTEEGRERLRQSMKQRWAAKRAAKRASKRGGKRASKQSANS